MAMTTQDQIVFAAAVAYFRRLLDEYNGRPENLKAYLLRELARLEERKEEFLAGLIERMI